MNWDMIGAVAETIGAIAVVLSLLYLGRQLRSGTAQAKASSYSSVMGRTTEWLTAVGRDPEAAAIYGRGLTGGLAALDESERLRFILLVLGLMRLIEEAYLHHLYGSFPDWADQAVEHSIIDLMATPGYRDFWQVRGHQFSREFQSYIADVDPDGARPTHGQVLDPPTPGRA